MPDDTRAPPKITPGSPLDRWNRCFRPDLAALTPSEWIVFNLLANQRKKCIHSVQKMTTMLPLGERSIHRALRSLELGGLIECTYRSTGREPSHYRAMPPNPANLAGLENPQPCHLRHSTLPSVPNVTDKLADLQRPDTEIRTLPPTPLGSGEASSPIGSRFFQTVEKKELDDFIDWMQRQGWLGTNMAEAGKIAATWNRMHQPSMPQAAAAQLVTEATHRRDEAARHESARIRENAERARAEEAEMDAWRALCETTGMEPSEVAAFQAVHGRLPTAEDAAPETNE